MFKRLSFLWRPKRSIAGVAVLAASGGLLFGVVGASAAAPGPTLNLTDGQVVSGQVHVTAQGTGTVAFDVDGTALPGSVTDYSALGGKITFDGSSYEGTKATYGFEVNGVSVAGPTVDLQAGAAGSAFAPGESAEFPVGTVHEGTNTITFLDGQEGTDSHWDSVYVKNFKLVLDDGTVIADPSSAESTVGAKGINIGYKTNPITSSYEFTLDLKPSSTATLDTTALSEGKHTVTATDDNGSTSVNVVVDNKPLTLSLTQGQTVKGSILVTGSGGDGLYFDVDGKTLDSSTELGAGHVEFDAQSYDGAKGVAYTIDVNGDSIPLPATDSTASGADTWTHFSSDPFDAGKLIAGASNTVSFNSGLNPTGKSPEGVPDRVYIKNLRVVLDNGLVFADPASADGTVASGGIQIGYDRVPYETTYPFTFTAPSAFATWDTTTVSDGSHKVTVTSDGDTQSVDVTVDNVPDGPPPVVSQPLGISLHDGDTVQGTTTVTVTGDDTVSLSIDGEQASLSPVYYGGKVLLDVTGLDGDRFPNTVWINGKMVPGWPTTAATTGTVEYDFGPGFLQSGDNVVRVLGGTDDWQLDNPAGNHDEWSFKNLRVVLDDGSTLTDPSVAADQSLAMGDSPKVYSRDFHVSYDGLAYGRAATWDTTKVADGVHTLTATDSTGSQTVHVRVDNVAVSLSLKDGQKVTGTETFTAGGDDPLTVKVDSSTTLDASPITVGGALVADTSSYDASDNKLFINDVEVGMPDNSIAPGGAAQAWGNLQSDAIPEGVLKPGANTIRFVPGNNSSGVPDRVYLRNVKLVLDNGVEATDPLSANDTVINIGYGRPQYETEYTTTITLPDTGITTNAYHWDTTQVGDGTHTVTVTDGGGASISRSVVVDNTAPTITVTSPVDGQTYHGTDIKLDATAHDPVDGDLAVTLTLDGNPIDVGATVSTETLDMGDHTLVAASKDSTGLMSQKTVKFTTYPDTPFKASDPSPADGATSQSPSTTTLGVNVGDPTNDTLDVKFMLAQKLDFSSAAGVKALSGSTRDGKPTLGEGTELTTQDYQALGAADGVGAEAAKADGYPYQQFQVAVPTSVVSDNGTFDASWAGSAPQGERVVLSAWSYTAGAWVQVDDAESTGSAFSLSGEAPVADTVKDGDATLMVQEVPTYIGDSVDGKTRFAWLTDTQYLAASEPATYDAETQWIVDHAHSDHIAYTVHTGDIVDVASQDPQWVNASASMDILDKAKMPYGVVSGNHDYESGYAHYRKYFGEDRFAGKPWYGGTSDDNIEHYDYISTPEADYMFVYLTWSATSAEWQWVKDEIASHPNANVILGTHEQFSDAGSAPGVAGVLVGQGLRFMSEIIQPYKNVIAILSGHKQTSYVWVDHLPDGRVVLQVQGNYQHVKAPGYTAGGDGYMRYLTLDANNQRFTNDTFSVVDSFPATGGKTHAWALTGCEASNFPDTNGIPPQDIEMTEACQEAENFVRNVTIHPADRSFTTDYVGLTARTSTLLAEKQGVASGSRVQVPAGKLTANSTYLWYADVTDDGGHTSSSPIWSFSTGDPSPTTVAAANVTVDQGEQAQLTATLTPTDGAGAVTFSLDGAICTGTVSNGKAACTLDTSTQMVGAHPVSVSYAGDTTYAASSTTMTLTVDAPPAWDWATVYEAGDTVTYHHRTYQALWQTSAEVPSGDPFGVWAEFATDADGDKLWTMTGAFKAGDIVLYRGTKYVAQQDTRGAVPGSNPHTAWNPLS